MSTRKRPMIGKLQAAKAPVLASTETLLLKRRLATCINKLSDRDTCAIATAELEFIAQNLNRQSYSVFISTVSVIDSSLSSSVRRQCVRILGLLSRFHGNSLSPFLPKLTSAVIRHFRDSDTAIRSACADAIGIMASNITKPKFSISFLKPISDFMFAERDYYSQIGSAVCLAAAIDAAPDPEPEHLQRVIPKLLKLLKSEGFKEKAALLSLVGSFIKSGGVSNAHLLEQLIPCLNDFLRSDNWKVRKAAADALVRLAIAEKNHLAEFRSSCIQFFETKKFDKIKVVRETMKKMLEAWEDIPCYDSGSGSSSKENTSSMNMINRGGSRLHDRTSTITTRKKKFMEDERKFSPLLSSRGKDEKPKREERNAYSKTEARVPIFCNKSEETVDVQSRPESGSQPVTNEEKTSPDPNIFCTNAFKDAKENQMKIELSSICDQLLQIHTQQSNLLDLLERLMRNSDSKIASLETRVHTIETSVGELLHKIAAPSYQKETKITGIDFLFNKLLGRTQRLKFNHGADFELKRRYILNPLADHS